MADLVRRIEAGDPGAADAVKALEDRCPVVAGNRSLFDVAILAGNDEVVAVPASDAEAREFHAPLDDALATPIAHVVAEHGTEYPVSGIGRVLWVRLDHPDDASLRAAPDPWRSARG